MAMPNIPGLDRLMRLDDNFDLSDEDVQNLDDELEAILSGRIPVRPPARPQQPRQERPPRSAGPSGSRTTGSSGGSRRSSGGSAGNRPPPNMMGNFDLNHLDRMNSFEPDDEVNEMELNDADLMSELEGIMGMQLKSPQKTTFQPDPPIAKDVIEPAKIRPPVAPSEPSPDYEQLQRPLPVQQRRQAPQPPITSRTTPPSVQPSYLSQSSSMQTTSPPVDDRSKLVLFRDGYKQSALAAKKSGNNADAMSSMKISKQLDIMITAIDNDQPVDMSNLPPPPPVVTMTSSVPDAAPTRKRPQPDAEPSTDLIIPENPEVTAEESKKLFQAPEATESMLEALQQRLEKYKSTAEEAQTEGNSSKARRIGRIVKQYESAVKANKTGKDYDYEALPNPLGWAELPTTSSAAPGPPASTAPVPSQTPVPVVRPTGPPPPRPTGDTLPKPKPQAPPVPKAAVPSQQPVVAGTKTIPKERLQRQSSVANKQLTYLLERQEMFKKAALDSKNKGDIQQAKEYLRQCKGFDPLIEATRSGLPIDTTSIPTPPQLNEDFVMVSHPEPETDYNDSERDDLFRKVEIELNNQIDMCKRNKEYFLQLGDVNSSSKFEKYAIDSVKDLDMLRAHWVNGDRLPRYHYETRSFSIVICNPELGTNETSVEVVKAIDLPGKSDIDTYVKIEFPFPTVSSKFFDKVFACLRGLSDQETPQIARTRTVKDSINPDFKELFKFDIDRKSRALVRIFKRHPVKLELYSKGGFLRSDALIGTASVKLMDFEQKCTIYDSFPLMDGRKVVGGKVEARIRIREPLMAKQVEEVKEKWLVFE